MIGIILSVSGLDGAALVTIGAITRGFIMALFLYLAQPFVQKITGSDDVGFGHFETCGSEYVGQSFLVFSIVQTITFAGGVYVILAGVRLIPEEIVPAFTCIATTILPYAKPAIDCPVVYPYAPNAVLIGFLSSSVEGGIGMGILLAMNTPVNPLPIILPRVVPHFFCGATAGVFITFLPVLLMPVLGSLGFANTTFSDADFCVVGAILGNIINLIK